MIGGLMAGELVIIAGRPSMGKSAIASTMARAVAMKSGRVAFFSPEMTERELFSRWLAMETSASAADMRRGDVSLEQIAEIEGAANRIAALPISVDAEGGIPLARIKHRARAMKTKRGLDLVIVDYIGLVAASDTYRGQKVYEIGEITGGLKALAKDLGVPVLALSQLSRALEHRDDKRPNMADLRSSGDIEQDADCILLLYREEYYLEIDGPPNRGAREKTDTYADRLDTWETKRARARGTADIIVAKQRQGPTGVVRAQFNAEKTMFGDLARQDNIL